jgi:hypothetical protein
MSVGLRIHGANIESDWGVLSNSEADPKRGLDSLMLVVGDYVRKLIDDGPQTGPRGGYHSVTTDGQRIFAHLDYAGQRTTWELFEARFEDRNGPEDLFIGRWPD